MYHCNERDLTINAVYPNGKLIVNKQIHITIEAVPISTKPGETGQIEN